MRKVSASYLPREKLTPIFLLLPCNNAFLFLLLRGLQLRYRGLKHTPFAKLQGGHCIAHLTCFCHVTSSSLTEQGWHERAMVKHSTTFLLPRHPCPVKLPEVTRQKHFQNYGDCTSNCAKSSVPDSIRYCFEDVLSFQ